jgi:rhodanese-related sulfurtransferase
MENLTVAHLVADAKNRIEGLSPTDVAAALDGETFLVDVREPEEREAAGIIPGSFPAPRGVLEFWADPASASHREEFDRSRRIILYCDSGDRSALAADALQRLGHWRVAYLEGGLQAWVDFGRHVEAGKSRLSSLTDPQGNHSADIVPT